MEGKSFTAEYARIAEKDIWKKRKFNSGSLGELGDLCG